MDTPKLSSIQQVELVTVQSSENILQPEMTDIEREEAIKFAREVQGHRLDEAENSDEEFGPTPMVQLTDYMNDKVVTHKRFISWRVKTKKS
jgi:hypothetical protein